MNLFPVFEFVADLLLLFVCSLFAVFDSFLVSKRSRKWKYIWALDCGIIGVNLSTQLTIVSHRMCVYVVFVLWLLCACSWYVCVFGDACVIYRRPGVF